MRLPSALRTVLTGEFQPQETGTRVKGAFDLETTSKIAICLFGVVGLLILILIVLASHASHPVLSVILVCAYGLLLFAPRIFRGIGRDQERNLAGFLKETLVANDDLSPLRRGVLPECQ